MTRPLTRTQEVVLIGSAFVTGAVLQICVILHVCGV